jgi:hypothetical protein
MKSPDIATPLDELVSIQGNVRALCGNTLANEMLDAIGLARQDRRALLEIMGHAQQQIDLMLSLADYYKWDEQRKNGLASANRLLLGAISTL